MMEKETIKALEMLEFCKSMARRGKDVLLTPDTIFEIEKIIERKDNQLEFVKFIHINDVKRLNKEIKRLQKANESFSCMGKMCSEIKAEARAEFWNRIKAMYGWDETDVEAEINIKDIEKCLAKWEEEEDVF